MLKVRPSGHQSTGAQAEETRSDVPGGTRTHTSDAQVPWSSRCVSSFHHALSQGGVLSGRQVLSLHHLACAHTHTGAHPGHPTGAGDAALPCEGFRGVGRPRICQGASRQGAGSLGLHHLSAVSAAPHLHRSRSLQRPRSGEMACSLGRVSESQWR